MLGTAPRHERAALAQAAGTRHLRPPMDAPLFDTTLARRRLARARAAGYADFLLARVAEDLEDRLAAVLRRFTDAVDLGTPASAAARLLARRPEAATTLRLAPLPEPAESGFALAVADPEALPLGPASIDLAVSLLALQGVNDLPGTLIQLRRALRPDGLFLGCLLGGATLTELRQSFGQAESEVEGGVSPRVAPFAAVRELGSLMQRAGFALPVVDAETVTVRYADPFRLMRDLRALGLTNVLAERRRTPLRRDTLMRAAALYQERFADPDGRVRATFELLWVSGWAPHASQQKPLRPGSAQTRLADALGTTELHAGLTSGPSKDRSAP
ncbi:Malonyl-[acyl-carrier protein] O-methyltransferase [Methylobacterium symbioticum]|uniref:Malonyl-[acyl-carrier protein] O-methyltransferase n=2 Tax=Methylobacterium symbioticum TaxID=2584084 RepID=A0A509E8V2_9HYPH|nr:Malonyl-[acyl-carrier protein] O-methyltransferase [Methylobacterium symbioticum]